MKAIIAVNNLGYIGLNSNLPWECSEDLKHFKEMTKGKIMLVGYNTFQTLPEVVKKRPIILDERERQVDNYQHPELLREICIGGKKTYEKYSKLFTELHISHINDDTVGDVMFPDFKELRKDCKIFHYYFEPNQSSKSEEMKKE